MRIPLCNYTSDMASSANPTSSPQNPHLKADACAFMERNFLLGGKMLRLQDVSGGKGVTIDHNGAPRHGHSAFAEHMAPQNKDPMRLELLLREFALMKPCRRQPLLRRPRVLDATANKHSCQYIHSTASLRFRILRESAEAWTSRELEYQGA